MGQNEIFNSLKRNPNEFFSAHEIGKILKINVQSASAALKRLHNSGDVVVKSFTIGKNNTPMKKFCFVEDDELGKVIAEFGQIRQKYPMINTEVLSNLMILKELREMRKYGSIK